MGHGALMLASWYQLVLACATLRSGANVNGIYNRSITFKYATNHDPAGSPRIHENL